MDVHELYVVFELATSATDAFGKDHLSQVLMLLSEDVEDYAMYERV